MNGAEEHGDKNERTHREGETFHGPGPRVHGILQGWLLLLLAEEDNHGYRLVQQLVEELPDDMTPDRGVIYRMLRTLEHEGYVVSTLQTGSGGPARKMYSLTPSGRSRLDAWHRTAQTRRSVLERFLQRVSRVVGGER